MRIDELVVRVPVTVDPSATIADAARSMAREAVGCLVVVDHDQLVGVVTDRDLVVRGLARQLPLDARIDAVMSTDVVAVDEHSDVRDVIRVFGHHAVRRLPVVRGRAVVGVVSLDELLVALQDQVTDLTTGLTAQLLFPHAADEPSAPAVR